MDAWRSLDFLPQPRMATWSFLGLAWAGMLALVEGQSLSATGSGRLDYFGSGLEKEIAKVTRVNQPTRPGRLSERILAASDKG